MLRDPLTSRNLTFSTDIGLWVIYEGSQTSSLHLKRYYWPILCQWLQMQNSLFDHFERNHIIQRWLLNLLSLMTVPSLNPLYSKMVLLLLCVCPHEQEYEIQFTKIFKCAQEAHLPKQGVFKQIAWIESSTYNYWTRVILTCNQHLSYRSLKWYLYITLYVQIQNVWPRISAHLVVVPW